MIMLNIFNFIASKIGIFICKFRNYRKKTFNMSVIFVTTILIFAVIKFFFTVANYSNFAGDLQFWFFDTFQDHGVSFRDDMLIDETNKIFQMFKRLTFLNKKS